MRKRNLIVIVLPTIILASLNFYLVKKYQIGPFAEKKINQSVALTENPEFAGVKLNCDEQSSETEKQACVSKLNKVLNTSKENCGYFNNAVDKATCEQSYLIKDVQASGDLQKCNQLDIEAEKVNCISQASFALAVTKKDQKFCQNIENQTDAAACNKLFTGK